MISINCNHPDLLEFIDVKNDLTKITKANISIKLTNDFMQAALENKDYLLEFIVPETNEVISKTVNAKDVLIKIAQNNWNMGEPGALFWDTITSWNIVSNDKNFEYAGTNPCGEEPLPAGGSCLLGCLNISEFIKKPFTKQATLDFNKFQSSVKIAVKALNEVLHEGMMLLPLSEQKESVNNWRQIGLGILGWHDALIKLNIKYGSEESLKLAEEIGYVLKNTALQTSAELTKEFGKYPKYDEISVLSSLYVKNSSTETLEMIKKYGLANSQILTIPPTGSIANMFGVSNALEPIYNISYTRKTESLHGKEEFYKVYSPIVEQYMKAHNIEKEEDLPDIFVTAMTLNWKERINMQAMWQQFIDASISSTVNLPESTSVQDIFDLYIYAWQKGVKGITVFRDNCARSGILTNDKNKNENIVTEFPRGVIEKVPSDLEYRKYKLKTGCGYLYIFIGVDDEGKIYDCFTNTNGDGGCVCNTQANSRLLSAGLRGGVPVEYLIEQLEKAGSCASYAFKRGKGEKLSEGRSCPSAIAHVLKKILQESESEDDVYEEIIKNKCPECGSELQFEAGCYSCHCGWSKCE